MASLVIGYGNDLRCDDGAGRVVADRIEAMDLPNVRVLSVVQLTPELAIAISEVDRVVFVDASIDVLETTAAEVAAEAQERSVMTHYSSPGSLLEMAGTMGNIPAAAFTVSIPVSDLGLGTELTPTAIAGVEHAVRIIVDLLGLTLD